MTCRVWTDHQVLVLGETRSWMLVVELEMEMAMEMAMDARTGMGCATRRPAVGTA